MLISLGYGLAYPRPVLGHVFPLSGAAADFYFTNDQYYDGTAQSFSDIFTFARSTAATDYDTSGLIESNAINVPRFDYDHVTGAAKGFLIEEQKTNLIIASEDFTGGLNNWTNGATIESESETSPDGTNNASLISFTSLGNRAAYNTVSVLAETEYTFSYWCKLGTKSVNYIAVYDETNAAFIVDYEDSGAVSTGWKRVKKTFTTPTGCTSVRVYVEKWGGIEGTGSVLIWGAQLEEAAYVTSYISTSGSIVTRTKDICRIQDIDSAPWFNNTEGTFVIEGDFSSLLNAGSDQINILAVNNGANNIMQVQNNSSGQLRFKVRASSTNHVLLDFGTISGDNSKIAIAYADDDFAACLDGATVATDTSGTVPTVNEIDVGSNNASSSTMNGTIARITYYNTRLSDSELQILTS